MSHHLDIETPRAPDLRSLCESLGLDDLRGVPGDASWFEGSAFLYREGLSTRDTAVAYDNGRLRISMRVLASREDVELAVRLAVAAARAAGAAVVDAEGFGEVAPEALEEHFDAAWWRSDIVSGARSLAYMIRDGRGPMGMPGPLRSCWIGSRLLAELEQSGPPERFAERVLAILRRVQWGVPASFRDAGVFKSGEGDAQELLAVWFHDEDLVIPRVHSVALSIEPEDVLVVPSASMPEIAGDACVPLDECQWLVRAIAPEELPDVLSRARARGRSPGR